MIPFRETGSYHLLHQIVLVDVLLLCHAPDQRHAKELLLVPQRLLLGHLRLGEDVPEQFLLGSMDPFLLLPLSTREFLGLSQRLFEVVGVPRLGLPFALLLFEEGLVGGAADEFDLAEIADGVSSRGRSALVFGTGPEFAQLSLHVGEGSVLGFDDGVGAWDFRFLRSVPSRGTPVAPPLRCGSGRMVAVAIAVVVVVVVVGRRIGVAFVVVARSATSIVRQGLAEYRGTQGVILGGGHRQRDLLRLVILAIPHVGQATRLVSGEQR
mmetsp:Transcript_12800/g.27684  ORF Transcript_12800/g.27684 Transcript_12800/m.27684 type:complete len:267 (+) Transcript_12800:725-1525(+)